MGNGILADLNRHAEAIGRDRTLVQGAGGNLSGKVGDVLWVKASGTRFVEALDRPVFVAVDTVRARTEVLEVEDLRHLVVECADERASRPSIETALHTLLPHRFVFHVHSVGAVAASTARDQGPALRALGRVARATWVPYAKPGIALARAVLGAAEGVDPSEEAVFLLGNHGLLTAAADADRARTLVDDAEAALRRADLAAPPAPDGGRTLLVGPGALDAAGRAFLSGGVITPDEAVFLGPRPFGEPGAGATCTVLPDGSVQVPAELSEDAREIAWSMVVVAGHADPAVGVRYLDQDEVAALVDWEAEKWRQAMQR